MTLAAVAAAPAGAADVSGEVVVRFKRGADIAAVKRAVGLEHPRTFAPHTRAFTIRDGDSVAATVRELRALPEVATAAPNAIARVSGFIPNDDGGTGQPGGWQQVQWNFLPGIGVNAPDAWQHLLDVRRGGGRGVTVAVLDTGVAYANRRRFRRSPDFARGDFVRGYDFVGHDRFPNDANGHGTHVAGTIGERTDNGIGVTGLAYGARIMPVRVLDRYGGGDSVTITAGIRYAVKHGADVINLSFEFDDGIRQASAREIPDILAALRYARRHDVVVVAAAGNQSRSRLAYPARYDRVLAVGAITESGCHAAYSNTGRQLDIVAPGGGPDDADDPTCDPTKKPGRDIFQMTYHWAGADAVPRAASYRRFGLPRKFAGTSMAAPHASAAAALVIASRILGRHPTPRMVEDRLKATAVDGGVPGFDSLYGYGRLDAGAATDPLR
ncbi:MAG TPA: S8 family serine peptidase [Solirubrobacteraceae bacterium]|nr:S8 family serine peptidase [Solirubrobacteraceae bacterium]